VREESHLDDMRAAIRGDFHRLAERRGGQELMREPEHQALPEPDEPAAPEPALLDSEPASALLEPEPREEPVATAEPEPVETGPEEGAQDVEAGEDEAHKDEAPRPRGFLDRLLGR
jgi:hypothetical protein